MKPHMDVREIMEVLPHRFPMLMVDRILTVDEGKSCRGLKNVTANEAFFEGHYPGQPVMPGVLIIESMAQAGAVILLSDERFQGFIPLIGAIDEVKFRRQVVPGDALISDVELLWLKGGVGKIKAVGSVEGEVVAQMEMTFKLVPRS